MKKFTLLLCVLLILSLCACTSGPNLPANVIDTEYFTLTLPEDWSDKCKVDLIEGEEGEYTLAVYQKQSHDGVLGGHLFSIIVIPTDRDYNYYPRYELLAAFDTPKNTFYAVAIFPTDVQFTEESAETYLAMFDQIYDVLYTMQPKDGIEMAMP